MRQSSTNLHVVLPRYYNRGMYSLLLSSLVEVLKVGKVFWVSDSSQDLEAILQMKGLVIDLAIEDPVHSEKLDKNLGNGLEGSLESRTLASVSFWDQERVS